MRLTEAEFIEIEERAARKFRVWERNYAPQDIRLEHHLSWWIAQEVAEHLSHKDEIHAPSVERCAQIAEGYAPVFQDMQYAPLQEQADDIAAALRELMKEVG